MFTFTGDAKVVALGNKPKNLRREFLDGTRQKEDHPRFHICPQKISPVFPQRIFFPTDSPQGRSNTPKKIQSPTSWFLLFFLVCHSPVPGISDGKIFRQNRYAGF